MVVVLGGPGQLQAQERTGRNFAQGLDIDLEYSYYLVTGDTFEEIHRELQAHGPEVDGRRFYALTGVETGFGYRHVEEGSTCRLEDVGVHARVVMRIPQWSATESASVEVQAAWDRFEDRLTRHEGEHYRIIESATRRIYNALRDMRVHSCSVADDRARMIIRNIAADQASANKELDVASRHGALDGAVWPPDGYLPTP